MQKEDGWYTKEIDFVLSSFKTSREGLNTQKINVRLEKYGENRLTGKDGVSWVKILLDQIINPLTLMLIFAGGLSLFLGEKKESIAILVIIFLNTLLGFFQEFKANKSIEALSKLSARRSTIRRSGKEIKIDSRKIVPGDILILEAGDIVGADARIISSSELNVNESGLTGESVPIGKKEAKLSEKLSVAEQSNMVFMGTTITQGRGEAVVVATGNKTEFGKIAESLEDVKEMKTPLQSKFSKLARQIGIVAIFLILIVFSISLYRGNQSFTQILLFSLVLAVGTIPSALPLVVTLGLSFGARRLANNKMLIRSLSASESLGSATFICTDKTGTLTKNEMTVTRVALPKALIEITGTGYDTDGEIKPITGNFLQSDLVKLAMIGATCNTVEMGKDKKKEIIGDPMEASLLVFAEKVKIAKKAESMTRLKEFPFDSERKVMSVVVKSGSAYEVHAKGAPEMLIDKCSHILINGKVQKLTKEIRRKISEQQQWFGEQAFRVLGFAYKKVSSVSKDVDESESSLIFVGITGMIDPERDGVSGAITECHNAGIEVMMITGDHEVTAKAIAKNIGLLDDDSIVMSSEEFDRLSDKKLMSIIEKIRVVARAYPLQKLRIIQALQKKGHIVAMTGDGVNDAPALKKADIGLSMGISGTEVAKESSKAVLVDDHFTTIVGAIREGRNIYDKIIKSAKYLLSCNFGEIMTVMLALFFDFPIPLLALQILLINMLTDTAPATGLGLEKAEDDVMKRSPRRPDKAPITAALFISIILTGLILGSVSLFLFHQWDQVSIEKARTMAFSSLVLTQMFAVTSTRTFKPSLKKLNLLTNKALLGGIVLSLSLLCLTLYVPLLQSVFATVALEFSDFAVLMLFGLGSYVVFELNNYLIFYSPLAKFIDKDNN